MKYIATFEDNTIGIYKTIDDARKAIYDSIDDCFSSGDLYAIYKRVSVVKVKAVVEETK